MAKPYRTHRLLGGYGRSVHYLRQPLYRDPVVAPQGNLRQGTSLQRQVHTAVFPGRWHRPQQPRAQPAGLLPRCQGHNLHRPVQGDRGGGPVLPRLDHHPVDPAVQYGALRGTEHRLREGKVLQSIHRSACHLHRGPGSRGYAIQRENSIRSASGGNEGQRTRGNALRTAHPLVPSGRGRIQGDCRGLRVHRGRNRNSAHRADLRCR